MTKKRRARWKSDAQFNYGSPAKTNVEVIESGDDAYIRLLTQSPGSVDVDFSTPADYSYDPTKIEVIGGVAKLKGSVAGNTHNWPFTVAGNYAFDGAKIEVTGGVARLKEMALVPYAWWHLNESSGTNCIDSSGNGRNGTTKNMEDADWVAGKLNNCLKFNEGGTTDEYVDCGNVAGFELTDSFSFEFWIKILGWNVGNIRVIYKYDGTRGYLLYVGSSRIYVFLRDKVLGGDIWLHGSTSINLDEWYHVVITYDGSSVAAGFEIYVNGNLETKTILTDTIAGGTITTGATLRLCGTGNSYYLNGYLDEVVVYDRELTAGNVAYRYNGGVGTESMLGVYSADDPDIYPNAGWAFTSAVDVFTETATKPSGTEIKYQISSDNGVTWKWWDGAAWVAITGGQTDSWYYINESNSAMNVSTNISSLAGSGTLKFKAFLHSAVEAARPELDNIYVAVGVTYPIGSFEISMVNDIRPTLVVEWKIVTETVTKPANTDIKYQYSINAGTSYSEAWLTANELQTALQGLSPVGDGTDTLRIKTQLTTSAAPSTPEIDNLNLTYDRGYATSGSYVSVIFIPNGDEVCWNLVDFTIEAPEGTTLSCEMRFSANLLDPLSEFIKVSGGQSLACYPTDMAQWKVIMTGDGAATPILREYEISYEVGLQVSADSRTIQKNSQGILTRSEELLGNIEKSLKEVKEAEATKASFKV